MRTPPRRRGGGVSPHSTSHRSSAEFDVVSSSPATATANSVVAVREEEEEEEELFHDAAEEFPSTSEFARDFRESRGFEPSGEFESQRSVRIFENSPKSADSPAERFSPSPNASTRFSQSPNASTRFSQSPNPTPRFSPSAPRFRSPLSQSPAGSPIPRIDPLHYSLHADDCPHRDEPLRVADSDPTNLGAASPRRYSEAPTMSWICCPCRCRRRVKDKAVHTLTATIRCSTADSPQRAAASSGKGSVSPLGSPRSQSETLERRMETAMRSPKDRGDAFEYEEAVITEEWRQKRVRCDDGGKSPNSAVDSTSKSANSKKSPNSPKLPRNPQNAATASPQSSRKPPHSPEKQRLSSTSHQNSSQSSESPEQPSRSPDSKTQPSRSPESPSHSSESPKSRKPKKSATTSPKSPRRLHHQHSATTAVQTTASPATDPSSKSSPAKSRSTSAEWFSASSGSSAEPEIQTVAIGEQRRSSAQSPTFPSKWVIRSRANADISQRRASDGSRWLLNARLPPPAPATADGRGDEERGVAEAIPKSEEETGKSPIFESQPQRSATEDAGESARRKSPTSKSQPLPQSPKSATENSPKSADSSKSQKSPSSEPQPSAQPRAIFPQPTPKPSSSEPIAEKIADSTLSASQPKNSPNPTPSLSETPQPAEKKPIRRKVSRTKKNSIDGKTKETAAERISESKSLQPLEAVSTQEMKEPSASQPQGPVFHPVEASPAQSAESHPQTSSEFQPAVSSSVVHSEFAPIESTTVKSKQSPPSVSTPQQSSLPNQFEESPSEPTKSVGELRRKFEAAESTVPNSEPTAIPAKALDSAKERKNSSESTESVDAAKKTPKPKKRTKKSLTEDKAALARQPEAPKSELESPKSGDHSEVKSATTSEAAKVSHSQPNGENAEIATARVTEEQQSQPDRDAAETSAAESPEKSPNPSQIYPNDKKAEKSPPISTEVQKSQSNGEKAENSKAETSDQKAESKDERYEQPLSDLAQQAYKHLEVFEEQQRRSSKGSIETASVGTVEDQPDAAAHRHHSETEPNTQSNAAQQNAGVSPTASDTQVQTKAAATVETETQATKMTSETTTGTDMVTHEIETQCEDKQFHEQSCQSEDFPIVETSTPKKPEHYDQLEKNAALLAQYRDLRDSLFRWLEDTEELVQNQKPPSADPKVASAELQNHKFQLKLIEDKQESVEKFTQLAVKAEPITEGDAERGEIRADVKAIEMRYQNLVESAHQRQKDLLDVKELGGRFEAIRNDMTAWMDNANKQITVLCKVLTDENEIQKNVLKQQELQTEIGDKFEDLRQLDELCGQMCKFVSAEDTAELDNSLEKLNKNFDELQKRSIQCGENLGVFSDAMRQFLAVTDELSMWLDDVEQRFSELENIPLDGPQLEALSMEFADIANAISERESAVTRITKDSRELCQHTSGAEALQMSQRIDRLQSRYKQLVAESVHQIEVLASAIRLNEELPEIVEQLEEFLDACDDTLTTLDEAPLDEQFECVVGLDEELTKNAPLFTDVEELSREFRSIAGNTDVELLRRADELRERYAAVGALVDERKRRLNAAEVESREVFDAIDFWLQFLEDAYEKSTTAERPPADLEQLKQLIRQQSTLNERLVAERAGIRNLIAEAQRVVRDINSNLGAEDPQMEARIERIRKLVDETAAAGAERLRDLELLSGLCRQLVPAYDQLNVQLSAAEDEWQNCAAVNTGQSADELKAQQLHNNNQLRRLDAAKQTFVGFERTIAEVIQHCSASDRQHLLDLCGQLGDRLNELNDAFRGRGAALDTAAEQSSRVADRLEKFLANLDAAAAICAQLDPIAAQPMALRRQIAENMSSIQLTETKKPSFEAMLSAATELLSQSHGNAAAELSRKIDRLNEVWLDICSAYKARDRDLNAVLPLAEDFWASSAECETLFKLLRSELDAVPDGAVEPHALDFQQQLLDTVKSKLDLASPQFGRIRDNAAQLMLRVGEEGQLDVQRRLQLLDTEWDQLSAAFAQRVGRRGVAADRAAQFFHTANSLIQWLHAAEQQLVAAAHQPIATEVDVIRNGIDTLQRFRADLNGKALERDALVHFGHELAAHAADPQQSASIREPLNDLNGRFAKLYALCGEHQHRLERALMDQGQFEHTHAQLSAWLTQTEQQLDAIGADENGNSTKNAIGPQSADVARARLRIVQSDINAHVPSFDALRQSAASLDAGSITKLDSLLKRWAALNARAAEMQDRLERSKADADNRLTQLDKWQLWVEELEARMGAARPVGALPETVQRQLDELNAVRADADARADAFYNDVRRIAQADDAERRQRADECLKAFDGLRDRATSRDAQLQSAMAAAKRLAEQIRRMTEWTAAAEARLNAQPPVSHRADRLRAQIAEHDKFVAEVAERRAEMTELHNQNLKVQIACDRRDTVGIKNQVVTLKAKTERIAQRATDRMKELAATQRDTDDFSRRHAALTEWIDEKLNTLEGPTSATTRDALRDQIDAHERFVAALSEQHPEFDYAYGMGCELADAAPNGDKKELKKMADELKTKWEELGKRAAKRSHSLDEAMVQLGKFDDALSQLLNWLAAELPPIEAELAAGRMHGDTDTLQQMIVENHRLAEELHSRNAALLIVQQRAEAILSGADSADGENKAEVREKVEKLNAEWERLAVAVEKKDSLLQHNLTEGVDLTESAHKLAEEMNNFELAIRKAAGVPTDDENIAAEQLTALREIADQFAADRPQLDRFNEVAQRVLAAAHPRAREPVERIIRTVTQRHEQVSEMIDDRHNAAFALLGELRQNSGQIEEIIEFVARARGDLEKRLEESAVADSLPDIQRHIVEHAEFKEEVREHQVLVADCLRFAKRTPVVAALMTHSSSIASVDDLVRSSMSTLNRSATSLAGSPKKSPSRGRAGSEKPTLTARQRRADQMNELFTHLWADTIAAEDRLKERRADIEELKRLENFAFAEWRERYLAWNDSAKARISDLFRRIDRTGAGHVPRQQFIDGVLASKFPTTRLEMERVADEFDKNGEISSKEFMNALRYEGRNRHKIQQHGSTAATRNDPERIDKEIKRETERCCCAHSFRIVRDPTTTGNTVKYAFGDSSMKRLVRILHSTVMVRVGGGWEELSSFLLKHDPCRAKGRTNLELYQNHEFLPGFATPAGAVDSMGTFARKSSAGSTSAAQRQQILEQYKQGPVMKIREKTERSIPMFKKPQTPASSHDSRPYSRQSSDLSIKTDGSRIPIPLAAQRSHSRPSSRASEASDLSGTPSRIPLRKTSRPNCASSHTSSARQSPMLR